MSIRGDDDESVGYGRPPKHSQFKKGQSGNPRGRRPRSDLMPQNTVEIINGLLLKSVKITEKGKSRWVPAYEAILIQLLCLRLMMCWRRGCVKFLRLLVGGRGISSISATGSFRERRLRTSSESSNG